MEKKKTYLKYCLASFITAVFIMLAFLLVEKYAPFGVNSLATNDINNTQMDLYGYLKDVFEGKNSLGYSFSMGLGGNTANVVSYSMLNPLNLLILFFDKAQFVIFFNIMAVLKIGFIAFAGTWYLEKRFHRNIPHYLTFSLGLGYAFSAYSLHQICNIFWLDGVMMLPFILYGLYQIIDDNSPYLFVFSVALSIIFNWYTGAINCIFTIFWYLFETFLYSINNEKRNFSKICQNFCIYALSGIAGVMLSAFVLLPTFSAVKNGNRGTLNLDLLRPYFRANPLNAISSDIIGSISEPSYISLYCGAPALIGAISYFFSRQHRPKEKTGVFIFAVFIILCFYWQPLHLLFSMLKKASSFFFRYGYIGIFSVIFVGALFYSTLQKEKNAKKIVCLAAVIYILALTACRFFFLGDQKGSTPMTIVITLLATVFLVLSQSDQKYRKTAGVVLVISLTVCESFLNNYLIQNFVSGQEQRDPASAFSKYYQDEERMVDTLQIYDDSQYRITETSTRNMSADHLTANYDEAFAFHYWGVSAYTNSPSDQQRNLLDEAGYRINGENYNIVNTSILPFDSLIGVKYVLSSYDMNGLEKVSSIEAANGKSVYYNPYALPMVYMISNNDYQADITDNHFENINEMYSSLVGRKVEIFRQLNYSEETSGTTKTYQIEIPDGNFSVYGDIQWDQQMHGMIYDQDGNVLTAYSAWGSPSVFYIPSSPSAVSVSVSLSVASDFSITNQYFYGVDLDALKSLTDEVLANSTGATSYNIQNTHVSIHTSSDEMQKLMTSLPYDNGWDITIDGVKAEPDLFQNCLMCFDLSAGEHDIEMTYKVPGLSAGIFISFAGLGLVFLYAVANRKWRPKMKQA